MYFKEDGMINSYKVSFSNEDKVREIIERELTRYTEDSVPFSDEVCDKLGFYYKDGNPALYSRRKRFFSGSANHASAGSNDVVVTTFESPFTIAFATNALMDGSVSFLSETAGEFLDIVQNTGYHKSLLNMLHGVFNKEVLFHLAHSNPQDFDCLLNMYYKDVASFMNIAPYVVLTLDENSSFHVLDAEFDLEHAKSKLQIEEDICPDYMTEGILLNGFQRYHKKEKARLRRRIESVDRALEVASRNTQIEEGLNLSLTRK